MKNLLIICLSLSVISGRLEYNNYRARHHHKVPAGLQLYWLKKTKKEIIRDGAFINPLRKVIGNSMHFIWCGSVAKMLPFKDI